MAATTLGSLLIVDDEKAQLMALCNTLRDQGYVTVGVSSGEEALDALGRQEFDLLLTDLKMPGMDGIAVLRAAFSIDAKIVGIVMTGHGTIATAVEAMQAGALDYILKPFKLSAVLPILARALAIRRLRLENARLERDVRQRTAELEAANKELDAFSSSVSHDLRAPLRAVIGFSSTLADVHAAQFSPEARETLDRVRTAAARMQQLIDDLLRFSRLGRQPLAKQRVRVAALVGDLITELQREQDGRAVEVRVGDLPDIVADLSLLKQVFANLLSNAFKFTRKRDRATVEVSARRGDGEIVFSVRDNGVGFDMQYATRLFGVFQRLHGEEDFAGTGVGLSLVQRIVHRHGGRIWAEAEVDKGAVFHIAFPD
jgi:two-component system sensor histidine kinase/response regulator